MELSVGDQNCIWAWGYLGYIEIVKIQKIDVKNEIMSMGAPYFGINGKILPSGDPWAQAMFIEYPSSHPHTWHLYNMVQYFYN